MKWPGMTIFAVAIAGLGPTVFTLGWIQNEFGTRFSFPLAIVAVGIPSAIALCRAELQPVRVAGRRNRSAREPQAVQRRTKGGSGKGRGTQARTAQVTPKPLVPYAGRLRRTALIGAAFCGWVLLSMALSPHPALAVFGEFDSGAGAVLSISFVAAWSIGVCIGQESAEKVEYALLGAVGLNALVALYQAGLGVGLFEGRAPGLMFNPVVLGSLMLGGLWLVARRAPTEWRLWGPAAVVVSAAIQVSGSRLEVALIPLLLLAAIRPLGVRRAFAVGLLVALGFAVGSGLAAAGRSVQAAKPTPAVAASAPGATGTARLVGASGGGVRPRIEAWSMATHAIGNRPLIGAGPGMFRAATTQFRTLRFALAEGPDRAFEDAHNLVVEYATTTGLVGAALLIGFVLSGANNAGLEAPLAGFAIVGLLTQLAEPQHPELTPLLFLALGAASASRLPLAVHAPEWARWALAGGAALASLTLAIGCFDLQAGLRAGSTPASRERSLRTARGILRWWADPYVASAILDDPTDPALAARWEQHAVVREPFQDHYWSDAGTLVSRAQGIAHAGDLFHRAIAENPWSPTALLQYGNFLKATGRAQEARSFFDRAVHVEPGLAAQIAP